MTRKLNVWSKVIAQDVSVLHVNPAVFRDTYQNTDVSNAPVPLRGNNKIAVYAYVKVNNAPLGAVITTYFYKNGVEVKSTSTTYGSAITKDTLTLLCTHTDTYIDDYDAYRTTIKFLSDVANDFTATVFVEDYLEDDSNYLGLADQKIAFDAVLTPGASVAAGNPIVTAIQLRDLIQRDTTGRIQCMVYVTSHAAGLTPSALGVMAAGADGDVIEILTADTSALILSETDGDIDITMTKAAPGTLYLWIELPNGIRYGSGALIWS